MTHKIDDSYNNQSLAVKPGDIIEIKLAEIPTSGYRWAIADNKKVHGYNFEGDDYEVPHSNAMGGAGLRTLKFSIHKAGKDTIKLHNWQPWSKDISKTFELNIFTD